MESAAVAPESSSSTVTLAPRIVRTSSVPVSLFNGTDRVQVEVYDATSGALLNKVSANFDARTLRVDGIPASASVRVDIYGLDVSSSYLWYGSSTVLAASSAASGLTIDFDISITPYLANLTPYLGDWVYVNSAGTLGDHSGSWTTLVRFGDDGAFRWENFFVNATGDVLSRYISEGSFVQVGSDLALAPSDTRTCAATETYPSSTCNSDSTLTSSVEGSWTASFSTGVEGLVVMIGTARFPFTAPSTNTGVYPITGYWIHSHAGTISPLTGTNIEGTWATSIRFSADGTYIWVQMFSVGASDRVARHYVETGTYVRNGTNLAFTPAEASSCDAGLDYLTISCADITDGVLTTPDAPSTWGYSGQVGTMSLTTPGGNTWEFTKQPAALGSDS